MEQRLPECLSTLEGATSVGTMLSYPIRDGGKFTLDTDASDFAMGEILSQEQNREGRVIAYAIKTLSSEQQNYCAAKKELLAVVIFVEHFRQYFYGTAFTIRTDNSSLRWLHNFRNIDGMLARWLASLARYDYTIVHRKGDHRRNADNMSRIPTRKCPRNDCPQCTRHVNPVSTSIPEVPSLGTSDGPAQGMEPGSESKQEKWLEGWMVEDQSKWQNSDPHMSRVISWLTEGQGKPRWKDISIYGRDTKAYVAQWESFLLKDGILCRIWYPRGYGAGVEGTRLCRGWGSTFTGWGTRRK